MSGDVSRETREQLGKYRELLLRWNRRLPLVSRKDPEKAADRLISHSLAALELLPETIKSVADIGSGGGLPGIVLAIACPALHVYLIERSANKCAFLRQAARELTLENIAVANQTFTPETIHEMEKPRAITSIGVGGYGELADWLWPELGAGDGALLFIPESLASEIAGNVSCETWRWKPLEDSDSTGVAWFLRND